MRIFIGSRCSAFSLCCFYWLLLPLILVAGAARCGYSWRVRESALGLGPLAGLRA